MRWWTVLAFAVAAATVGAAAARADEGPVRIAEFGSLSGTDAGFGGDVHDGIVMAVEEANAAGGVKLGGARRTVVLTTEDDHSRRDDVEAAVRKLLDGGPVAVLGGTSSSLSQVGAVVCQKAGVPLVCPAATLPAVTQVGDHVFRACYLDTRQGQAMARFARGTLKVKSAGVLTEGASEYSRTLGASFAGAFKLLGGAVPASETYSRRDNDFKAQLTHLRQAGVDVLYVPGLCTQVAQIANQARDTGLQAILLGGDGWDSPRFRELGGNAVLGAYFTNHYSPLEKRPAVTRFVQAFQARYHRVPTAPAALGHDAARLVLDALERAGHADRAALTKALAATKDFPGVTGSITLDAHRDARKPVLIVEVTADGYEPRDAVAP